MLRSRRPQTPPGDLIGHHVGLAILLRQQSLFDNLEHAIVTLAADVARPVFDDGGEQHKLSLAAILEVELVRLDRPCEVTVIPHAEQ